MAIVKFINILLYNKVIKRKKTMLSCLQKNFEQKFYTSLELMSSNKFSNQPYKAGHIKFCLTG